MYPNPSLLSRLGIGGLMLFGLGTVGIVLGLFAILDGATASMAGLVLGDEQYRVGDFWWLFPLLGMISLVEVFRIGFGWRDWLAPVAAAIWLVIGAGYAVGTQQFGLLVWTAVATYLITSGTLNDRRAASAA